MTNKTSGNLFRDGLKRIFRFVSRLKFEPTVVLKKTYKIIIFIQAFGKCHMHDSRVHPAVWKFEAEGDGNCTLSSQISKWISNGANGGLN